KQIDSIGKEKANIAVLLITNRLKALDPAVIRRATQVISFNRPDREGRRQVFESLLAGGEVMKADIEELVVASERGEHGYSFSDLVQKVGRQALIKAIEEDRPFDKTILLEVLRHVHPSPLIKN